MPVYSLRTKLGQYPEKPDEPIGSFPSRIAALGWNPQIPLRDGIAATYRWYLDNKAPGATLAA